MVARRLGAAGVLVTLAVRDVRRGRQLAAEIPCARVRALDLADLYSVRRFATDWEGPVDVLVNNAGVMMTPLSRTAEGAELQWGTNHLGHFVLTTLLAPHLTDRVVTVVSRAHRFGRLDLDDPDWRHRRYSPMGAYAASKLANLVFTRELQRRFTASGSPCLALAADPGFAATDLARHTGRPVLDRVLGMATQVGAQSPTAGARPILSACAAPAAPATWFGFAGPLGLRGDPTTVPWPRSTTDPASARRVWQVSVDATGVDLALIGSPTR